MKKFPPKEEEKIFKRAPKHEPSIYQKRIYKDLNSGIGHTVIEAFAGSAKTYSIVEGIKYIPKGKKVLMLAFNKSIRAELRGRVSDVHDVLTFHGCGLRALKLRFGEVVIDEFKTTNIIKKFVDEKENDLIDNLVKAVSQCKNALVDTPSKIEIIMDHFSIDTCELERKQFISIVIKTLAENKKMTNIIDFDDMCLFPHIFNLNTGNFDYVFIDERQDSNTSNIMLAIRSCKKQGGRIIACGDKYQNIYASFRGTDDNIIQNLLKQENAKILSLPISYRCPTKVLDLCRLWVKDIQAAPGAKEGSVEDISLNQLYDKAKPGSFVLSRTNAPLIKICMNFIKQGKKANIKGRDVGNQLNYLIKKSKQKEIPQFLKWLENWKQEQIQILMEKKIPTDNTLDRYECLTSVAEECKSLKEMKSKIDSLFNDVDDKNVIICSSVHKSKGLEAKNVFLLRWTFRMFLDENTKYVEYPNEELNIAYVACSRAQENLYLVHKAFSQEVP